MASFGPAFAKESVFSRLLWPTRYYNATDMKTLAAIISLMPLGDPMYKTAFQVHNKFAEKGLLNGYLKGDMLGTAFFDDFEKEYWHHKTTLESSTGRENRKAARNGL